MKKKGIVYLTGAGPGDPGLLTLKARAVMAGADCIVYDKLANAAILDEYGCEKIYVGKSGGDHSLPQQAITRLLIDRAGQGDVVVRLKGGDPFVFGRGGEEAAELAEHSIAFEIIPGISALYAAPAYAGIPVTHRDYADSFEVITGHRRADGSGSEDIHVPRYRPGTTFVFMMAVKNLSRIAAALVREKGFPTDMPAALISWGTRPEQRTITGTLHDIDRKAAAADIRPPAVFLVGQVVRLREQLCWFDRLPLFGTTIVVTRTRSQASALSSRLSARGARVIEFPTIAIKPAENTGPLTEALKHMEHYDWMVLTSQNAVRIVFEALFAGGQDARALGRTKIAVIGPATADALFNYGIAADVVPEEYVAEGLLRALAGHGLEGCRLLLPCAEEARPVLAEGLRAQGAIVDRLHLYRSLAPQDIDSGACTLAAEADMITFASSSTVRNFFALVPHITALCASIGPVTSQTLRDHGYEPAVQAEEYTVDGLIRAIEAYYAEDRI